MVGTLSWNDVSDLSIFKCKICKYRLQYPVMEVETFGYTCGNCYDKSAYTNVSENTDIERILSKLCIPCKYSERGCYFDGSFQKTSEHEKQTCPFRDKVCPFSLITECDATGIKDVVDHIMTVHEDCFISTILEENCITIKDPMEMKCAETNPDAFYFFEFQEKHFLFHCNVDMKQQKYNYLLYHFDDNVELYHVTFCLIARPPNLSTTKSEKISAIPYTEMLNTTIHDNVLKLNSAMLAILECTKELKILLNFKEYENNSEIDSSLMWHSCTICQKEIMEAHVCAQCDNIQVCKNCYKQNTKCSTCSNLFTIRSLSTLSSSFKITCKMGGCDQFVRKDEYELHWRNCPFRIYDCPYKNTSLGCEWTGFHTNISEHLLLKHNTWTYINNIPRTSTNPTDKSSYYETIIKNNITIKCRYRLNTNNKLLLKIGIVGPTALSDLYMWELHLKNEKIKKITTISSIIGNFGDDDKFDDFDETIDVSNYVIDDELEFGIYIHHRDM